GPDALPLIVTPVTIEGNGSTVQAVATSTACGVPSTCSDLRLFELAARGNLRLTNVTVTGGSPLWVVGAPPQAGSGGDIFNDGGVLTLAGTTLSDGLTQDGCAYGGGLVNLGRATLSGSSVMSNETRSSGGGIYNSGSLTIDNTTL